ncbi:MAG: aminotransferase class III-fold pyridoxal phosphate-dependent enzyme [Deltaproteobacteria bacterium]|nr:aminotransferase class III-fold pyridoxal phosphate-dependent enzyme [Deltaproteobacteria bacterium]
MSEPGGLLPVLLGRSGPRIVEAMTAAQQFLAGNDASDLLRRVGETIPEIPKTTHLDKRFIQASYRGELTRPPDDLLTGLGLFYVTEQRKLFLDCTAGHYQMTWGYHHPRLNALLREALDAGVVWDDHSNIPGNAVKRLSVRLVEVANGCRGADTRLLEDPAALNTVLLGVCTGSVAASSALKLALVHHQAVRPDVTPVFLSLRGNYHGTDFLAQRLRGMWKGYFRGMRFVEIEPNDLDALRKAFAAHRGRVAAMFVEPILMNREAILLDREFLREARTLCDEAAACLVLDEIQTGFWHPRVFLYHEYGIVPDILIVGKGMTAGLHPLSAIVYRRKYDRLAQYDAISTNGNAPLAAVAGLGCLALAQSERARIEAVSRHYFNRLQKLPAAWPGRVAAIRGKGLMAGVKFHAVADALEFHRRAVARGLWVRAHAYHEGHSTVLTKLALAADQPIADFIVDTFQEILEEMDHA